jgi:hypothetical protein
MSMLCTNDRSTLEAVDRHAHEVVEGAEPGAEVVEYLEALGFSAERARPDRMLEDARQGHSGVLVVPLRPEPFRGPRPE